VLDTGSSGVTVAVTVISSVIWGTTVFSSAGDAGTGSPLPLSGVLACFCADGAAG